MFLKAGLLSLLLLLASRVFGVLRETALAAAFGSSGMADVAIVMLTLPDWLAGVLVSGALAYVLLPQWAKESAAQQNATQNRVARRLLWGSLVLAGLMCMAQGYLAALLVPEASAALQGTARDAVVWSALALPAAMLAGLWATRLQHERDFVGLYSANLVVNGVLIAALLLLGFRGAEPGAGRTLGVFLLMAVVLRLLWQGWRMRHLRRNVLPVTSSSVEPPLPGWRIWMWAALGAGLPLTLPFVARTFASGAGEGALATFNYAWKLVELPLVLAIQLVASLAFPAIARTHAAWASGIGPTSADAMATAVRNALVLAWTLACAAAAALLVGAPVIASLLFGWGRMDVPALEQIAAWSRVGAWGLLPQALLSVALTVLASVGRMRFAVLAYLLALALLLVVGAVGWTAGESLMWGLNAGFVLAALIAGSALGAPALRHWLPLRALLAPSLALAVVAWMAHWWGGAGAAAVLVRDLGLKQGFSLVGIAFSAIFVVAAGWFSGPGLRQALRS
ncbi:lipid II flippase MurJ [Acidovorax sp. NPDC077693]|uniref:lipid II flippase MurJ n=1 Tax=unclassified Acidovorax TaxID=2684926 RepID=UPI0037C76A85